MVGLCPGIAGTLLLCSLPEVSVDERRRDTLGEREPLGFRFQASNLIVAPRNRQAFVGWFSEHTMDLPFAPVGTSVRILAEPFADGGRGDLLLIQPFDNSPYTQLLLCILAEESADNAGFRFVHLSYAIGLITPIAIEFCP